MKFSVEIQNSDTLEKHIKIIDKPSAQEAHKYVFINILKNNEEVAFISDEEGKPVFISTRGFF